MDADIRRKFVTKNGQTSLVTIVTRPITFIHQYSEIGRLKFGRAVVKLDDKYGMIDESGKEVLEPVYDEIEFKHGFIILEKYHKKGLIDRITLQKLMDIEYEEICIIPDFLIAFKLNGKWGFTDQKGNMIFNPVFDEIGELEYLDNRPNGRIRVCRNQKWGALDMFGKEVIPVEYDETTCAVLILSAHD